MHVHVVALVDAEPSHAAAALLGVYAREAQSEPGHLRFEVVRQPPPSTNHFALLQVEEVHELVPPANERGGIYAVWYFMLIKQPRPADVFCVASHGAKVMADYASTVAPRGVIANDAGMGLDRSGADGLPTLNDKGVSGSHRVDRQCTHW